MKDFFGRELKVGDVVAFEQPRYRNLVSGKVESFTPQQVRVSYEYQKRPESYITPPNHLIKRDA